MIRYKIFLEFFIYCCGFIFYILICRQEMFEREKLIILSIIIFVDRVNEIIRRQELVEERKVRLVELGLVVKKKKGKKGKKKGIGKKKGEIIVKKKFIC